MNKGESATDLLQIRCTYIQKQNEQNCLEQIRGTSRKPKLLYLHLYIHIFGMMCM